MKALAPSLTDDEITALPVRVSLETARRVVGVGRNRAYEMAREGSFPVPVRTVEGRHWVTKYDLLTWLESNHAED